MGAQHTLYDINYASRPMASFAMPRPRIPLERPLDEIVDHGAGVQFYYGHLIDMPVQGLEAEMGRHGTLPGTGTLPDSPNKAHFSKLIVAPGGCQVSDSVRAPRIGTRPGISVLLLGVAFPNKIKPEGKGAHAGA